MRISIELTNTASSVAWAVMVFLLMGMHLVNKWKK